MQSRSIRAGSYAMSRASFGTTRRTVRASPRDVEHEYSVRRRGRAVDSREMAHRLPGPGDKHRRRWPAHPRTPYVDLMGGAVAIGGVTAHISVQADNDPPPRPAGMFTTNFAPTLMLLEDPPGPLVRPRTGSSSGKPFRFAATRQWRCIRLFGVQQAGMLSWIEWRAVATVMVSLSSEPPGEPTIDNPRMCPREGGPRWRKREARGHDD